MKNIKAKLLSVLMVCAMILSFSACDSVNNKNSGSVASSSNSMSDNLNSAKETNSNGNVVNMDSSSSEDTVTDSNGSVVDKNGSAVSTDKNGSVVSTDKNGSAASTDKNGSAASTDKNGSAASTDKNGSAVSTDKNGSAVSTDKNSSAASTSKASNDSSSPATKDPFSLVVGDAKGKAGDTITVDLSIKDNPGVSGMLIEIDYDKDVLQVTDDGFEKGSMLKGADAFMGNNEIYPNKLVWADTADVVESGVFATLTIKIAKDAPKGEYEIKILESPVDICNANYKQLYPSTVAGKVTVE